jgi:hypothetical protein
VDCRASALDDPVDCQASAQASVNPVDSAAEVECRAASDDPADLAVGAEYPVASDIQVGRPVVQAERLATVESRAERLVAEDSRVELQVVVHLKHMRDRFRSHSRSPILAAAQR